MLVSIRVNGRWKRKSDGLVAKIDRFDMDRGFTCTDIRLIGRDGLHVATCATMGNLMEGWKATREKCQ